MRSFSWRLFLGFGAVAIFVGSLLWLWLRPVPVDADAYARANEALLQLIRAMDHVNRKAPGIIEEDRREQMVEELADAVDHWSRTMQDAMPHMTEHEKKAIYQKMGAISDRGEAVRDALNTAKSQVQKRQPYQGKTADRSQGS